MFWRVNPSLPASLCRWDADSSEVGTEAMVKAEIASCFEQARAFSFGVDQNLINLISSGQSDREVADRVEAIHLSISEQLQNVDRSVRKRFLNSIRLSDRIHRSITWIHRALAELDIPGLHERRFVLIKERPGTPFLYEYSVDFQVIARVGLGQESIETPSIYLGLNFFDVLESEKHAGIHPYYDTFLELLRIEERAIETGYTHVEELSPELAVELDLFAEAIIHSATTPHIVQRPLSPEKPFAEQDRQRILKALDSRAQDNSWSFDHSTVVGAVTQLERLARRYKAYNDAMSLGEVFRLLIAASGHDDHEVRNRSNVALERILSLKEYDAPVAAQFATVQRGTTKEFALKLPKIKKGYLLRIFRDSTHHEFTLEEDLDYIDHKLVWDEAASCYMATHQFRSIGHCDWLVGTSKRNGIEWIEEQSGRVNVIPDVRGELILQIFPDVHGHSRIYWDDGEHPGLVYNEAGEVIRLGNLWDVCHHLEDLKERLGITGVYLLGVQQRGTNREDWAPEARSPSPFSPMSLVHIEPALGGERALKALVEQAHGLKLKVIVDVIPHLNRKSTEISDDLVVRCHDDSGNLVVRASTDGRFGSWNDGKLLNWRKAAIWNWMADSVIELIRAFNIDGIRFDGAHSVPIMMKRYLSPSPERDAESFVEGEIIVNDREDEHFITTGFYDSACRDIIANPFHLFLSLKIHRELRTREDPIFFHLAECYWGREQVLARNGVIPYNSALFKICENITHGESDIGEIYHLYNQYYPNALVEGTELVGILGNHDERRPLNTFGSRGLKAATMLTAFMNNICLDYEGNADGEAWKIFVDNIYVNWNDFETAAFRGVGDYYRRLYEFITHNKGKGYLIWSNNRSIAAAAKVSENGIWIGAFNFSDSDQFADLMLENPEITLEPGSVYRLVDPTYSAVTGQSGWYTANELKYARIGISIAKTDRIKLLKLIPIGIEDHYQEVLLDSFDRLCRLDSEASIRSSFAFAEIARSAATDGRVVSLVRTHILPAYAEERQEDVILGLKRAFYYATRFGIIEPSRVSRAIQMLRDESEMAYIGERLAYAFAQGHLVFLAAESEPFTKSGGLANVVFELPRELAALGENSVVITPKYLSGDAKSVARMETALKRYKIKYSGKNVRFYIHGVEYEVGVHTGIVEGVHFYLLEHHEFFDGLYWGYTGEERLRRRTAFARASAEVIKEFDLKPSHLFTNDAFTGVFSAIVRSEESYAMNPVFRDATLIHIIHNGGWQYHDSYQRFEDDRDIFATVGLGYHEVWRFGDPSDVNKLNCMAAAIHSSNRVVTVSPSYARQIERSCDGLEPILHNVLGISNGISEDFRDRIERRLHDSGFVETNWELLERRLSSDKALLEKLKDLYPEILEGPKAVDRIRGHIRRTLVRRTMRKMLLQCERGLNVDPDILLFSMIHRIAEQKGFQILLRASETVFVDQGWQGIIGGALAPGDSQAEEIAGGLLDLCSFYPGQVSVGIGFQDVAAPLLASDAFLMPSLHEPGGISQLEALACGCFVVARATGGLRDTVTSLRIEAGKVVGNGILFSDFEPWELADAMKRFSRFITEVDPINLHRCRRDLMRSEYTWRRPAEQYLDNIYLMKEMVRLNGDN